MNVMRMLVRYLRPHVLTLVFGLIALLVASASLFAVGLGLSRLTDLITRDRTSVAGLSFDQMALVAFAVLSVYAIGLFFRDVLMRIVGQKVSFQLRSEVYRNLLELDPAFYDVNSHSELQTRLVADTQEMERLVGQFVPNTVHYVLLFVAAGAYAIYLNPFLALIIGACVPLVLAPGALITGRLARLAGQRQDAMAKAGSYAAEILRNLKLMQSYGQQRASGDRYSEMLRQGYRVAARAVRLETALGAMTSFIAFGVLTLIIWYGGREVLGNTMAPGDLVGFIFYANLATMAVAGIMTQWAGLRAAAGAAGRLLELGQERSKLMRGQGQIPSEAERDQPVARADLRGAEVEFAGVGFAYPSGPDRPVLHGIDLRIEPGEMLAIVGPSGSGKSTMFDLVQGFYPPSTGSVRIDGRDTAATSFASLAEEIALVPQRPELLSGRILDNVRVGRADATEAQVWDALRRADAESFVQQMPEGLETDLGHDAGRLSGGQRQRLSIARALVRQPRLLLFDEPTSALDVESEAWFQQTLRTIKGGQTILVITHSLATAACADRVALMIRGQLVAVGPHDELQRNSPAYAALVRLAFLSKGAQESLKPQMLTAEPGHVLEGT
jgi:ATP-binding cassette subfamily B protein